MPLAKEFIDRVNRTAKLPNAGITIVEFFENVYIPAIEGSWLAPPSKGTTTRRCHIRDRVGGRVRDFRTVDGENLINGAWIETLARLPLHDSFSSGRSFGFLKLRTKATTTKQKLLVDSAFTDAGLMKRFENPDLDAADQPFEDESIHSTEDRGTRRHRTINVY